ncbi:beta-class carbonic anhydrase [Vulgatibacter sp.]|uniref:beta-class carbonic anhydrase n=1 Tax=Vulgatibacter sp. TaxID=1971226 RepID=UPI00356A0598
MALLHEILEHNARFVHERNRAVTKVPQKKVAIFTCMDTRLVDFLEQAMGLGRGDAKMLKNAGNTLIDPQGGMIRSLVVAVHALGCEEVLVIGHTDCGMAQIDEVRLERSMLERGVPAEAIASLQPSLRDWLGAFHHPVENVQDVVKKIRENPLIPKNVPVHGLIFDPVAGKLQLLTEGYDAAAQGA